MARSPDQIKQLKYLSFFWGEADKAMLNLSKTRAPRFPTPFRNTGTATLGLLDLLPLEIIHIILESLDFRSLGNVRLVNIRGRFVVQHVPAYQNITTYCHAALRGLAAVGLLGEFCANYLYSVACDDRCVGCGAFGSFFNLPKGRRCCVSCITDTSAELGMISTKKAAFLYGLTNKAMKQLTRVLAVPGSYTMRSFTTPQNDKFHEIVNRREALDLSIQQGSKGALAKVAARATTARSTSYTERRIERFAPDRSWQGMYTYMTSTPFPYLNLPRRRVENGLWCHGCQFHYYYNRPKQGLDRSDRIKQAQRTYSEDEFLDHFEECEFAKILWEEHTLKGLPIPDSHYRR